MRKTPGVTSAPDFPNRLALRQRHHTRHWDGAGKEVNRSQYHELAGILEAHAPQPSRVEDIGGDRNGNRDTGDVEENLDRPWFAARMPDALKCDGGAPAHDRFGYAEAQDSYQHHQKAGRD